MAGAIKVFDCDSESCTNAVYTDGGLCPECTKVMLDSAPVVASADSHQIGGSHYRDAAGETGEQHWNRIWRMYGRGYFVGCATKYIERYHLKNGKQDLEKAVHFIQKLIELEYGSTPAPRIDVPHNTEPKEKK